jgi:hypothetical protein
LGVLMMKHIYGAYNRFKPCIAAVAMMLIFFCFFPAFSWGRSIGFAEGRQVKTAEKYDRKMLMVDGDGLYLFDKNKENAQFNQRRPYLFLINDYRRNYNHLSPEEKTMLQRRLKEWESLSPERQRILRHRMEEYNRLPSRERHLFRQRYRRLQKLSPDERHEIREKLRRWNALPPGEKEQIRRRFREP